MSHHPISRNYGNSIVGLKTRYQRKTGKSKNAHARNPVRSIWMQKSRIEAKVLSVQGSMARLWMVLGAPVLTLILPDSRSSSARLLLTG